MDIENLSTEEITSLAGEKRAAFDALAALEAPTLAQVEEAEGLLADITDLNEAAAAKEAEAEALAARSAALKSAFAEGDEEVEETAEDEVEEADDEEVEETAEEAVVEVKDEKPVAARSRVTALKGKVARPKAPAVQDESRITITAAAEVPDFGAGEDLGGMEKVAEALVSRLDAFGTPTRTTQGAEMDLRFANVAKFALSFPDELNAALPTADHQEVIKHATDESRLESEAGRGSLTAAGGWCTPSENLYDLCEGETLDGMISVPEIQVSRGGINFTKGPDFSTLYADSDFGWFLQTETQAEAGATKACYELDCPTWTDVRLDAVGLCLKIPILTNAAFPELTQRIVRGAMVAHQHKVNANVIGRMVTAAGAAEVMAIDYTSTGQNLFANIARVAEAKRQKYYLGFNQTMEVILPFWLREAIRDDLAFASGRDTLNVDDAEIDAGFRVRRLNVQWVADWQLLDSDTSTAGYPLTVQALMYPAGTFVKGVSDVINLSAVYDAASLAVNVYTGLFFEQGLLVANTCFDADLLTIPLCGSGRRGIANVSVCGTDAT
jgi:hypothetical protein